MHFSVETMIGWNGRWDSKAQRESGQATPTCGNRDRPKPFWEKLVVNIGYSGMKEIKLLIFSW